MPRAGVRAIRRRAVRRRTRAAFVFHAADRIRRFAGELGGAGDGRFDEADFINQAVVERLLGGEDLAGGDGIDAVCVVFELRPAADDDLLEIFETVVDEACRIFRSASVIGRVGEPIALSVKVRDVDCDFRLLRRSIFSRVTLEKSSGVICLEMMKKIQDAGFRITEVPVHHYHRAYGRSQFFNFRRLVRTGIDVAKLWYVLVIRREHLRAPSRDAASGAGRAGAAGGTPDPDGVGPRQISAGVGPPRPGDGA